MKKITPILFSMLLVNSAMAAEVIVRLHKAPTAHNLPMGFTSFEPLIPSMNIYLLRDNTKSTLSIDALSAVNSHANVKGSMLNSQMSLRSLEPNDPKFNVQWGMQKIQAPNAWTLGVGGRNSHRDDVVVAVVDGGVDVTHEDLLANIWTNTAEIPGNNIDDDKNGYVDDINGWSAYSSSGKIPKAEHGTHVAGIVGAQGNNSKHTSGVNWNVKIMAVAASSGDVAVVLKGYGYVIAQKKLWLESKGKQGANVVATNSSFGVDRANCKDPKYKLWNDIYEQMGQLGILSAVATANQAWDIDAVGDVPSSCATDYVITVTNTTKDDVLFSQAGWGAKEIDIASPGTDVMSTVPGNSSRNMTGTSMATPHVAGSIGFLASVASNSYTVLSKENPAKAALVMKSMLMDNVDKLDSLKGKTVSEGRLNLYKSADAISRY